MAFYTRQHPTGSVDTAVISIATATRNTSDPRTGQLYNLSTLAAADPVWFHPLSDGRCVGLFARRLTNAVLANPQTGGPLLYSAATESTTPSWAVFEPLSGAISVVGDVPTDTVGQRVLSAAVSRGNYLFVLSRIGDEGLLQHFRVTGGQGLLLQAEEVVTGGLNLGLHVEHNDLWVFGGKTGKLTLARKNWGRIGENNSRNPFLRWRYRTVKGWSADVDDLAPLGGDIPATGPVSVARHRLRYYLTVPVYVPAVAATGTTPASPARWEARCYTSRLIDSRWTRHPFTVPLGGDADYLGGTVYLQPQLTLTAGLTTTPTTNTETVLDDTSHPVQVFSGLAAQTVILPAAVGPTLPSYTLYNKTPGSELVVYTASRAKVGTVWRNSALTYTPTVTEPLSPLQWTVTVPEERTPARRVGFPHVSTVRLRTTAGHRTLVTSWGVFEV